MSISFVSEKDPVPHFVGYDVFEANLKKIVEALTTETLDNIAQPAYNMLKLNEKTYILEIKVPGYKAKDIKIEMTGVILHVYRKKRDSL